MVTGNIEDQLILTCPASYTIAVMTLQFIHYKCYQICKCINAKFCHVVLPLVLILMFSVDICLL